MAIKLLKMKYIIKSSMPLDEGGSAEFYDISDYPKLGFKQFRNKRLAISAWNKQKLLSKFRLAPKVISNIIKLPIVYDYFYSETNWGFITEKASVVDGKLMQKRMPEIQALVDSIRAKTGLKFWDCHYYNIGYIKRNNTDTLVCIDTGDESFRRDSNAWGFNFPGPKCSYCKRYDCECAWV